MSENENDLTKTVTVKRSGKKKSNYVVGQQDGYYYIAECPNKARVRPGDRIVGINGISCDEFIDEDDANALIDSIRITVVPQDKLEEYDEMQGVNMAEDEELEKDDAEGDRSANLGALAVPRNVGGDGEGPKVCIT